MRENGYNLNVTMTGASAGALTATLTLADCDFEKATELALDMAQQAGVWDRKQGLQGIWGPMISNWLDQLLPSDAVDRVEPRLSLLVTPVPSFGKKRVDSFRDRADLIDCNMASVHLPWFLNGEVTTRFRDHDCIDGSFLAQEHHYAPPKHASSLIVLDYNKDPRYQGRGLLHFVEAISSDSIWNMLEDGKRYAKFLEENGELEVLGRIEEKPSTL
jgi:hypothetical protein